MLVNHQQLREYAECSQQAKLIEWLIENGIKFTLNRKGKPVTTIEQINKALEACGQEVIEFGQE
jgi:arsenate reductase-like glutaredoxin family protein